MNHSKPIPKLNTIFQTIKFETCKPNQTNLKACPWQLLQTDTNCTSGIRRKFAWGGVRSGSYGGHLYLVCAVCDVTIWRHIHVSKPTFWRSLL